MVGVRKQRLWGQGSSINADDGHPLPSASSLPWCEPVVTYPQQLANGCWPALAPRLGLGAKPADHTRAVCRSTGPRRRSARHWASMRRSQRSCVGSAAVSMTCRSLSGRRPRPSPCRSVFRSANSPVKLMPLLHTLLQMLLVHYAFHVWLLVPANARVSSRAMRVVAVSVDEFDAVGAAEAPRDARRAVRQQRRSRRRR